MTMFSLKILTMPPTASSGDLETAAINLETVQNLQSWARDCGPYALAGWAKKRGLTLHYVDNCWVRAVASGHDVQAFMDDMLRSEVRAAPVIDAETLYLIQAEEY